MKSGNLIWNVRIVNRIPLVFHNVAVYAGDKFYNPSEATIRKFQYRTSTSSQFCEQDWTYLPHTKNCYKYFSASSTQKEANSSCSEIGVSKNYFIFLK